VSGSYTAHFDRVDTDAALAYHERHKPQALIVWQARKTLIEAYDAGFTGTSPHALYSGTKSFWGITAVIAARERLLDLDEPMWRGATTRDLLSLTAGVPFGGLGASVPVYEKALAVEPRDAPGERFTYGGIPLQIFGAIFSQKLKSLGMTPHDYLRARVLEPAGVEVASWRTLKDGTHPLPTGAFLTAENWMRYGTWVIAHYEQFAECFTGTSANPRYGLGWWLAPPGVAEDLFYASGSGGQALYVVPSEQIVIARFGAGGSYDHAAFLRKLWRGHASTGSA
jgi:CubicO group peptidase (beta-lactamase class C family)